MVLTPAAVSVKYVDENGAAVSMDASVPTTANVGAVYNATVKVAAGVYDTSANSADVVVSGLAGANETFTSQNVATGVSVTSTANVAGNDFVVVTIKGLNKTAVTYTVTGLTATALGTLNTSITNANDSKDTIAVTAGKTSGILAAVNQLLGRLGCLVRLGGQIAHLVRHHGKALACAACPGCFHSGVQRKDIGLERNILDCGDNLPNFLGGPAARRLILLIIVGTLPLFAVLPIKDAVESLSAAGGRGGGLRRGPAGAGL